MRNNSFCPLVIFPRLVHSTTNQMFLFLVVNLLLSVEKKVNITDFAPSYKRIEHYGAMIASVAKGHSICGVIEIFSDHPSVRKYPLPSHQTLYRWVVLFSRLFREEIKEKVRGKHVTLTTDEWSALLSSSIIGKVLIFLYKFLSFCNFLFFSPLPSLLNFMIYLYFRSSFFTAHIVAPTGVRM